MVTAPLSTSLVTAQGTWAVAVMGGSAASHNNFWQLFLRPTGATRWSLVTPEGVADNGGLVAAGGTAARRCWSGFRPSQGLAFSPLAASTDAGRNWTPGLLDADLADVPDALAVGASGQALALLHDGSIEEAPTAAAATAGHWSQLTTLGALAASAPGHSCGLAGVNAVSFGVNDTPMAGGSCVRRGVAGVFAESGGTWQAAGPALPAAFGGDQVQVLGLAERAGRGRGADGGRDSPGRGLVGRGAVDGVGAGGGGHREGVGVRAPPGALGAARRGARGGHRRDRGRVAGAAAPCPPGPRRSRRSPAAGTTRWPSRGPGSPSGSSGPGGLGTGPGHHRADRVRFLGLGAAMSYLTNHWSFDPFLILAIVVAVWHEIGLWRLARRSRPERTRERRLRSLWFYAGLAVLLIAVQSPIDYWADDYFFVHMIQHLLLMFAAPTLIVAGAPWQPLLDALPGRSGRSVTRGVLTGGWSRPLRALGSFLVRPWVSVAPVQRGDDRLAPAGSLRPGRDATRPCTSGSCTRASSPPGCCSGCSSSRHRRSAAGCPCCHRRAR